MSKGSKFIYIPVSRTSWTEQGSSRKERNFSKQTWQRNIRNIVVGLATNLYAGLVGLDNNAKNSQ